MPVRYTSVFLPSVAERHLKVLNRRIVIDYRIWKDQNGSLLFCLIASSKGFHRSWLCGKGSRTLFRQSGYIDFLGQWIFPDNYRLSILWPRWCWSKPDYPCVKIKSGRYWIVEIRLKTDWQNSAKASSKKGFLFVVRLIALKVNKWAIPSPVRITPRVFPRVPKKRFPESSKILLEETQNRVFWTRSVSRFRPKLKH